MRLPALLAFFLASLWTGPALSHGTSLAVFKAVEDTPQVYRLLWKVNRAAASASINDIQFPDGCFFSGDPVRVADEGTTRTTVSMKCKTGPGIGTLVFPDNPSAVTSTYLLISCWCGGCSPGMGMSESVW